MSAGTGIVHSEYNHSERTVFLQIWILPKEKGIKPSYEQRSIDQIYKGNGLVAIGKTRKRSIYLNQDVDIYLSSLEMGQEVTYS
jgi:redox-sensitive bicupin YhaK (pirin superfamily)